jgi:hypothetical protein
MRPQAGFTALVVAVLVATSCGDDDATDATQTTESTVESDDSTPSTEAPTTTTVPIDPSIYGERVTQVIPFDLARLDAADPPAPLYIAYGADSLWVSHHRASMVSRVDPATGEIVANISIDPTPGSTEETEPTATGAGTGGGSIVAADDQVWVLDLGGFVWKIDPATNEIAARVEVPELLAERGAALDDGQLWMLSGSGWVRLDVATNELAGPFPPPEGMGLLGNGPQVVGTPAAVWFGSTQGAVRVNPETGAVETVVDVEPAGLGAQPLGTVSDLLWGARPDKVWGIDTTSNDVALEFEKSPEVGNLYSDSATVSDDGLWVLAAPAGGLGKDQWFELAHFDLEDGMTEHFAYMNAEFEFIVGMVVAEGSLWATDFGRGNLLRIALEAS